MDGNTLHSLGFYDLKTFQPGVQKLAPENKGCYAFCSLESMSLNIGSSDIMYIGRVMSDMKGAYHNLRHSLNEYLHPGNRNRTKIRVGEKALTLGWLGFFGG